MCVLWDTGYSVDFSFSWASLSRLLYFPSALRWKLVSQQLNTAVAGLLHWKRTSCNGLGNSRVYEMTEEALGLGTGAGPGMCNKELTFEMLILLPDLFGEG